MTRREMQETGLVPPLRAEYVRQQSANYSALLENPPDRMPKPYLVHRQPLIAQGRQQIEFQVGLLKLVLTLHSVAPGPVCSPVRMYPCSALN